jgi:uncharacterized protein (TIGR03435 family)
MSPDLRFAAIAIELLYPAGSQGQSQAPTPPVFEVASVRPCKDGEAGGGRSGGGSANSPGRLTLRCQNAMGLINLAYRFYTNGRVNAPWSWPAIEGGPAWINSDRYEINAKAEGALSEEMTHGPMLQALLEDRFKLKIHRETREIQVYALTVAKSGPRLQAFKEGSCTPFDFATAIRPPTDPLPSGQIPNCFGEMSIKGPNWVFDTQATTLHEISQRFGEMLDRPVIDRTGISGRYDFHLEFAMDETAPPPHRPGTDPVQLPDAASDPSRGPSIFTAIQQYGLRLERSKGPGEFLVIDHVEKPSEN